MDFFLFFLLRIQVFWKQNKKKRRDHLSLTWTRFLNAHHYKPTQKRMRWQQWQNTTLKKNKPQQYNPGEKTRDERNKWNDERKNGKHIKEKITDRIRAKKKKRKIHKESRRWETHSSSCEQQSKQMPFVLLYCFFVLKSGWEQRYSRTGN